MDWADSLLLGLTVGFIGVVIEAWSSRNDDLFVRRLSVLRWTAVAVSVTAVSWLVWSLTRQVWVTLAVAVLWVKSGEAAGGWIVERARTRQSIEIQNRARQLAYKERDSDGTTIKLSRTTS